VLALRCHANALSREKIREMHSKVTDVQRQLKEAELTNSHYGDILRSIESHCMMPPVQLIAPALRTKVEAWNIILGRRFGLKACMIVSEKDGKVERRLVVRYPLAGTKVLHCTLVSSWPLWMQPSLSPHLRVQDIISDDSEILNACKENNAEQVTGLILSGRAHPNDATPENLTLLYVNIPPPF
jgi:hypothetical protein